jgi:hypothetical protein
MALSFVNSLQNNRLDEITTSAGATARLRIYAGSVPADVDTALSGQTLLANFALSNPIAGAASSQALTLSGTPLSTTAAASGTASFFRIDDGNDANGVVQGTVGAGSGDLSLDTTTITSGQTVQITSFVINENND